jgi:D-glutamate cyclase
MTQIACDVIDKLLCTEMRRRGKWRGFKWTLYELARSASDSPLVLAAAEKLNGPPARIGIVTGAAVPEHMPAGENDGPFGSTVLARALTRIGHRVSILTDPACAPPIEFLVKRARFDAPVIRLALNDTAQQEALAKDFDVLVAVERLGGNPRGKLHGINGHCRDAFRCNVDRLFSAHAALGRASVSIADGGNEIGFGKIYQQVVTRLSDYALMDKADGGIFSVVPTDVLVIGSTSNLGAYGVVAALALLRNDVTLCHSPEEEIALHHVGVGLGLSDGGGGGAIPWCDGIPAEASAAMVLLMRNIVERTLEDPLARPF